MWLFLITLLLPFGESLKALVLQKESDNEILKSATVFLIRKYFTANSNWRIRFIIKSEKPDFELQQFMSDIIQECDCDLVLDINIDTYPDNFCRVFFVDSFESIKQEIFNTKEYYVSFCRYRLIVLKITDNSKNYYDEMAKIVQRFFSILSLIDVNFLIEPIKGKVFLYTYYPFSMQHCKPPFYPVKIDEFDVKNGIFPNEDRHYSDKTKNFFSCTLNVGVVTFFQPMIFFDGAKISGMEGDMINLMADLKNFRPNFTVVSPFEVYDGLYKFDELLINKELDMSIGLHYCSPQKMKYLSSTYTHFETSIAFIVKKNLEPFSSWQKAFIPFKPAVWLSLFATMFIIYIFSVIFKKCQDVLPTISRKVNYFYMSWLIIYGSPVTEVHPTNGGRLVLISFIVGTLIIRTVYQGKMYYNAKNQVSIPPPKTFQEIKDRNYAITAGPILAEKLKFDMDLYQRVKPRPNKSQDFYDYVLETNEKRVTICPVDIIEYFQFNNSAYNVFHIMKQRIGKENACIYLQKNSILMPSFNKLIRKFRDYGFTAKFVHQYARTKKKDPPLQPKAFSLTNGLESLDIILYFYGVCIFVFTFEVLSIKFQCLKALYLFVND